MRSMERYAALITLMAAAGAVLGQDQPETKPESEEPEAPPIYWNSFSIGYGNWDVSRNRGKLFQYAHPRQGFDLREFRGLMPGDGVRSPWGKLTLHGTWESDNVQRGTLVFGNARAKLDFGFDRHEFYDPTPLPVDVSHERNADIRATYRPADHWGLFAVYQDKTQEKLYAAPKSRTATVARRVAVGFEGDLGPGHGGVTYSETKFHDRAALQPGATQRRIDAYYGWQASAQLNLEGVFSNVRIQQRGLQDSNVRSWGIHADWDFSPMTSLAFDFRRQDLSMPNVENAYVRKRWTTGLRLDHRFSSKANLQLGFEHRETERVRADQTFVDVPKWNTWNGRLSGRLNDSLRYSVRGKWEHLQRAPVMVGIDPRSLYWDDRVQLDARLEYLRDRFNAYAGYGYRFLQNSPRNVEVTSNHLTVGAGYVFTDRTQGYVEIANDSYRSSGVRDGDGYDLDWFFPSQTTYALGLSHQFTPATSLSVALSHSVTSNDNPLLLPGGNYRHTELTATVRHRLNDQNSLELVVAPWTFRDRVNDAYGYRATMIGLNWSMKF